MWGSTSMKRERPSSATFSLRSPRSLGESVTDHILPLVMRMVVLGTATGSASGEGEDGDDEQDHEQHVDQVHDSMLLRGLAFTPRIASFGMSVLFREWILLCCGRGSTYRMGPVTPKGSRPHRRVEWVSE